jgi:hypothetical protein
MDRIDEYPDPLSIDGRKKEESMTTHCLSVGFCALTQLGALKESGSDGNQSRSAAQAGTGQTLGEQFAALELRFKAREKSFEDELHVANKLEANARSHS